MQNSNDQTKDPPLAGWIGTTRGIRIGIGIGIGRGNSSGHDGSTIKTFVSVRLT